MIVIVLPQTTDAEFIANGQLFYCWPSISAHYWNQWPLSVSNKARRAIQNQNVAFVLCNLQASSFSLVSLSCASLCLCIIKNREDCGRHLAALRRYILRCGSCWGCNSEQYQWRFNLNANKSTKFNCGINTLFKWSYSNLKHTRRDFESLVMWRWVFWIWYAPGLVQARQVQVP